MKNFIFIANAALGKGLSGSDRIFIELAKRWGKSGNLITICVWEEGYRMCVREGIYEGYPNCEYRKWFLYKFKNTPFIVNYFLRIFSGIYYACIGKYSVNEDTYLYACSDFWQDAIPALIIKIRYPKAKLISSFYLTAPNPFIGFKEVGESKIPSLKATLYFLQQQPIIWLIKKYANYVFVTSEPDARKFKNTIIIKGGVNVDEAKKYQPLYTPEEKKYDAVFLGRFHPQKGVLELIDIWEKVVSQKPDAQLIMLGDGPLRSEVEEKIKRHNLQGNITLTGYLFDGSEKYAIFRNSKLVVHPAVYDSGGMAAAEALVWGIPGISFDLEALKSYYPKGVLKIAINDFDDFAKEILYLLDNKERYKILAKEARQLVLDEWDWDKRAQEIMSKLSQ